MKKDKIFVGAAISIAVILVVFIITTVAVHISNTPTLLLVTEDGETPIKVKSGQPQVELTAPQKQGYTFSGWYLDEDLTIPLDLDNLDFKGKMNIYPKWVADKYIIGFNTNGGSEIAPIIADYDTAITRPLDPTKYGHEFSNWYIDNDLSVLYDFSAPLRDNIIIYAEWNLKRYQVDFVSNGGSIVSSIYPNHGAAISEPFAPTRVNFLFKGWFSDALCTTPYDFDDEVHGNLTLYAYWAPAHYNVTLDWEVDSDVISVDSGVKLLIAEEPERAGHTFLGWYVDAEYSEEYDFDTLIFEEFTLYGKWEINSYTVTFDSNGGDDIEEQVIVYNNTLIAFDDPERLGYTFDGWYLGEELFDFDTLIIEDLTIHARWTNNTYTITFNAVDGNVDPESLDVTFDMAIGQMPVAEWEHYDFVGWNTIINGLGAYLEKDSVYEIADDITLYAQYVVKTYYITFATDGGSEVEPVGALYNNAALRPEETPVKVGHTFIDWYVDNELTEEFDFDSPLTGDIVAYAGYSINVYTVTFNTDGGSVVDSVDTNYNTTILAPDEPTRTGRTFAGWWYLNTPFDFDTLIVDHIELLAQWDLIDYELTLNPQGGEIGTQAIIANYGLEIGALPNPAFKGHTFIEWNSQANGLGNTITDTTVYNIDDDSQIFAIWEINKYTVTFNSNGSYVEPIEDVLYNTTISRPADPERIGYTFKNWYYFDEEILFLFDFDTPIEDYITLIGIWDANQYTLTYNSNGGIALDPASKPVTYASLVGELPMPEWTGYDFVRWNTQADGLGLDYNEATEYMIADSMTIFAIWEEIEYAITYVLNDGVNHIDNIDSYTINSATFVLNNASKTGYTFNGWYLESEFAIKVEEITEGSSSDYTLYAKFTIIDYVINYFNLEGAFNHVDNPNTYTIYDNVLLKAPSKTGYTFDGWYDNISLTGVEVEEIGAGSIGIINVYAKWIINQYRVTFNSKGGSEVNYIDTDYNTTITKPADPERDYYDFLGWFLDDESYIFAFDFDEDVITDDVTLYALWEAIVYSITYVLLGGDNDESNPDKYTYESPTLTLYDAEKTGYEFLGWYLDNVDYMSEITHQSNGNMMLYAQWDLINYDITYYLDNGTATNPSSYTVEDANILLNSATKTGYAFNGWYDNSGFTGTAITEIDTSQAKDINLYAKFTARSYTLFFDSNEGDAPSFVSKPVTYDSAIGELPTVGRDYYDFVRWNSEDDGNGTDYNTSTIYNIASSIIIYAIWTPIEYSIAYNLDNGVNNINNPTSYTVEDTITIHPATRVGYQFGGWYDNAGFSGSPITSIIEDNGNKQLYAKWTANTYTINYSDNIPSGTTYDVGGYTVPSVHTYDVDKQLTANGYIIIGWTFTGWNSEENGSGITYTNSQSVTNLTSVNGDTIYLFAQWRRNTYTVDYNSNKPGGASSNVFGTTTSSTHNCDTYKNLTSNGYSLTGWTFNGWNTQADGSGDGYINSESVKNLSYTDEATVTLYAQWTANTYAIVYNGNKPAGASDSISGATALSNHTYDTAKPLTTNGYSLTGWTFDGWNTQANGSGLSFDDDASVSNLTSTQGGTVTLYAQWSANTYTIVYNANKPAGASGDTEGATDTSNHTYDIWTNLNSNGYSLTGWTFDGWNTQANGSGLSFNDDASVSNLTTTQGATFTLYVMWEAITYTVEYNSNKPAGASGDIIGSTADSNHSYDISNNLNTNGFSLTGWTFNGWNTQANGSGLSFADDASVINLTTTQGATVTLYAMWQANTYTIVYNANKPVGASGDIVGATNNSDHTYDIWNNLINNGYSLTGWTFYGWNIQADGLGTSYNNNESVRNLTMVDLATVTLHAQWIPNEYSIEYDANKPLGATSDVDGLTGDSYHVYDVWENLNSNNYSLTGWSFIKWNTQADGSGDEYEDLENVRNLSIASGGTVTLYAIWEANTYTVEYNSNKPVVASNVITGSTADSNHTYDIWNNLVSNGYSLMGWIFDGWNTQADGLGTSYDNIDNVRNLTAVDLVTVTLYAQWIPITYTIEYVGNRPSEASKEVQGITATSTHTYDLSIDLTGNEYSLTGWTFTGWNSQADGGGIDYVDMQSVENLSVINDDVIILYALWEANNYTITLDAQGGTVAYPTADAYYDDIINWLPSVVYDDNELFSFAGWFTSPGGVGDEYDDNTVYQVLGDITLYALWVGNDGLAFNYIEDLDAYEVARGTADIIYDNYIAIPAYYNGKLVIKIADNGFRSNSDIEAIIFAYGSQLEVIGDSAFRNCYNLSLIVDMPDTINTISTSAFRACTSLTEFTMPNDLLHIGKDVFAYCTSLDAITLNDGFETIGESAFAGTAIASIIIPSSITFIGDEAFFGCVSLVSVHVIGLPYAIGDYVFDNCNVALTIHVEYEEFKTTNGWSLYADRIVLFI